MSRSLIHVCPLCRVYDPAAFIHFQGCPSYTGNLLRVVSIVAARYRQTHGRIRVEVRR